MANYKVYKLCSCNLCVYQSRSTGPDGRVWGCGKGKEFRVNENQEVLENIPEWCPLEDWKDFKKED